MTAAYRNELAPIGLTYSQFATMLVLWEEEHTTLRDLGHRLYLDSGTLSPLLKRLEAMGYVTRCRDTLDERVLNVALTPAGRAVASQASCAQSTVQSRTGLTDDELADMRDQINVIADSLRERTAAANVA